MSRSQLSLSRNIFCRICVPSTCHIHSYAKLCNRRWINSYSDRSTVGIGDIDSRFELFELIMNTQLTKAHQSNKVRCIYSLLVIQNKRFVLWIWNLVSLKIRHVNWISFYYKMDLTCENCTSVVGKHRWTRLKDSN